jgi:hypothetical protein
MDGSLQTDSSLSNYPQDNIEIVCVGKCIACKIDKKIKEETQDSDFEDIEDMEYEETHFDYDGNIVSESSNYIDEENHFDFDEMNLPDSSNVSQDNQVFITTHEEEEVSHDKTISIEDDSYKECHIGICKSCHHIGIVGTECENCKPNEWASSIVKITPGWQIISIKGIRKRV